MTMIHTVSVKISDKTGLNKREQKILQGTVMTITSLTSALVVINKGQGGNGVFLNPLEDENYICGIKLVHEKVIDLTLAEELKTVLERSFKNLFRTSQIDMAIEIDLN